jgi:hypothetical protein
MRRNKEHKVVCVTSFTHVTPECVMGPDGDSVTLPEIRTSYTSGQVVKLSSHRARKDFVQFHAGKFVLVD